MKLLQSDLNTRSFHLNLIFWCCPLTALIVSCGFSGYTLFQYAYQPFRSSFIVELLRMSKCEEIHVTRHVYTDFPNTALSSQKDKIQAITDIWEETLEALVLFPLKSHCPICFQKDEIFLVTLNPSANISPLILC